MNARAMTVRELNTVVVGTLRVTVWFDEADPANKGWCIEFRSSDENGVVDNTSDPLGNLRRRSTGLPRLRLEALRRLGGLSLRFKRELQRATWKPVDQGIGWLTTVTLTTSEEVAL